MIINFLLPHYGLKPSGGFKIVYQYAYFLAENGYKVNIVHPASMNRFPKKYLKYICKNIEKRKVKYDWKLKSNNINEIYCPSLDEKYIPNADICFATAWQTAVYLNNYNESKGNKFYLIQHYETWNGSEEAVNNTLRYDMTKIVISKWLMNKGKELGVNDCLYLPNAINHENFKVYDEIDSRKNIICMMYSEVDWKGSKDGLNAINLIKEEYDFIKVKLFGKYKRPDNLPQWIEYYENPKEEELVRKIYNKSKIFLCTSWFEGWGLPPMEAMACGCAVVTTDNGGVNDFAIDEETALICEIKNPRMMAEKIKYLLDNDKIRRKLAINGANKVKEFTWDKSYSKLLEIINK